jgi:uncharacterized protein
MENKVVEVTVRGVMPTSNGCALFIGHPKKTFVIYVDQNVGNAISMTLNKVKKERPFTHDLIGLIFQGLGVTVERVIINGVSDGTFFARLIIKMENELGTKILEIDSRPSDAIILALQSDHPIYVLQSVLNEVEDMTDVLNRILKQQE